MKRLLKKIVFAIFTFIFIFSFWVIFGTHQNVSAATCSASPNFVTTTQQVTVSLNGAVANQQQNLVVKRETDNYILISETITTDSTGSFSRIIGPFAEISSYSVIFNYVGTPSVQNCATIFEVQSTVGPGACPLFDSYSPAQIYEDTNISAYFEPVSSSPDSFRMEANSFGIRIDNGNFTDLKRLSSGAIGPGAWQTNIGTLSQGSHGADLYFYPLNVIPPATPIFCYQMPAVIVQTGTTPGGGTSGQNPCGPAGCETALGNIPTTVGGFAGRILGIAIGLAGGIALILMVIGSIRVLTSSGEQQRLAGGRDMIVAAVAGLLFLIFSVLILRFIGVTLFGGTPGF